MPLLFCRSRAGDRVGIARLCLLLCLMVFSAAVSAERKTAESSALPTGTVVDWNATFSQPSGPSGTVGAFAAWDDGSGEALYVGAGNNSSGGIFTTAGGIAVNGIGRWNGVSWSALGSGLIGSVSAMVPFGDELVVCGLFNRAGGVPVTSTKGVTLISWFSASSSSPWLRRTAMARPYSAASRKLPRRWSRSRLTRRRSSAEMSARSAR